MFWILFAVGQLRIVGDWDEMTLGWLNIMMKQSFNDSFIIRYHSIINRSCTALPSRSLQVDHNVNERRCIWHSTSSHPRNNNSRIILRAIEVGQTLVKNIEAEFNSVRQGDGWIGAHAIPGLQKKHDERSHRSSELRGIHQRGGRR